MGKPGKVPRKFTPEFKAAAVQRLRDELLRGRTQQEVARALGISSGVLGKWRQDHEARQTPAAAGGESLEEEVRRLRREVETLRQERDFAKKAAAYFARDVP